MRQSIVKAKLARNENVLCTCLHLTDPSLHEIAGMMGFDAIWMDMEHHAYSVETGNASMRAQRVGRTDAMARPAKGEFMRMCRMLEAGAMGVLYPRCDDAKEAAEIVRWMKFPPMGTRGFDGGNADMPYLAMSISDYIAMANEQTWLAVQIEDQNALANAEAIAAVDGVDILFLGPADFSISAGIPGDFSHPIMQDAVEKIARAAKNTGKHWGMPAALPRAKELIGMGARFIASGCDLAFVLQGMQKLQADFGAAGFTFDNQLGKHSESYLTKELKV